MATETKDYNIKEADKMLKKYISLSGFNPMIRSRETKSVYFRVLFYKVLMDFNYMIDRQVADYFTEKGLKIHRSSIFTAVRKIDMYYKNYSDLRDLYDVYFGDKIEESIKMQNVKEVNINKLNDRLAKYEDDKLSKIIRGIPLGHRRDEMFEMVELRIKSWAWKSKDKCEIIEGSDGISGNSF